MLTINYHTSFKKELKKIVKRGYDTSQLDTVVDMLANEEKLPEKYRDHNLHGKFEGFRECHIQPNWLLIYQIDKGKLTLTLAHTGTHSDIL